MTHKPEYWRFDGDNDAHVTAWKGLERAKGAERLAHKENQITVVANKTRGTPTTMSFKTSSDINATSYQCVLCGDFYWGGKPLKQACVQGQKGDGNHLWIASLIPPVARYKDDDNGWFNYGNWKLI